MPKTTEFKAPSEMTRSSLLMQQKLNQRSKDAMIQREITPEILPTKAEVKLLGLDDDNPEAIADKHRKSTSIKIQLSNMANNAIVDELGWKPSKIKSETTQQMIDEYKAEMNQPVKVIDPDTGREVVYKYKPSSIDLTPVIADFKNPLSATQVQALNRQITDRLRSIEAINKFITITAPEEARKIDEDYNRRKAKYEIDRASVFNIFGTPPVDPILKYEEDKANLRKMYQEQIENRKQYELEIDGFNSTIKK